MMNQNYSTKPLLLTFPPIFFYETFIWKLLFTFFTNYSWIKVKYIHFFLHFNYMTSFIFCLSSSDRQWNAVCIPKNIYGSDDIRIKCGHSIVCVCNEYIHLAACKSIIIYYLGNTVIVWNYTFFLMYSTT